MSRLRFAVLLLVAAPAAAADKLPPELALIPPDAAAFVSVRLDRLVGSVLAQAPLFGDGKERGLLADFERPRARLPARRGRAGDGRLPGRPDQGLGPALPVLVVTRTKPIDRVALLRKLQARPVTERDRPPVKEPGRRPVRAAVRRAARLPRRPDHRRDRPGEYRPGPGDARPEARPDRRRPRSARPWRRPPATRTCWRPGRPGRRSRPWSGRGRPATGTSRPSAGRRP